MNFQKMINDIAAELTTVYNGDFIATAENASDFNIEAGELVSLYDYIFSSDIYDIKYIVSSDKKTLEAVRVMICCGGPNVYINTWDNVIEGFWWADSAKAAIPHEIAAAITEIFTELWAME